MRELDVTDIRIAFADLYTDWVRNGEDPNAMLQIHGASFDANEPLIFGSINTEYVEREFGWYQSQSLFVKDIPGGPPKIWAQVADRDGRINSNYGYLIYSDDNHNQFVKATNALLTDRNSRQAVMIYTRPSIHDEWNANGMHDFICTNAVQFQVMPDGELTVTVQMRSNDAIFGYRNDYAWQEYVREMVYIRLWSQNTIENLHRGRIIWQVGNLHIYPRHRHLVANYLDTGNFNVPLTTGETIG